MIEGLFQDLRHGARMLVKNPGFALVAIVSIAIGVGANAAMFSLADTLVLRPLSVPQADDIVIVTSVVPRSGFAPPTAGALAYPDYVDVRDQAQSFASLATRSTSGWCRTSSWCRRCWLSRSWRRISLRDERRESIP